MRISYKDVEISVNSYNLTYVIAANVRGEIIQLEGQGEWLEGLDQIMVAIDLKLNEDSYFGEGCA